MRVASRHSSDAHPCRRIRRNVVVLGWPRLLCNFRTIATIFRINRRLNLIVLADPSTVCPAWAAPITAISERPIPRHEQPSRPRVGNCFIMIHQKCASFTSDVRMRPIHRPNEMRSICEMCHSSHVQIVYLIDGHQYQISTVRRDDSVAALQNLKEIRLIRLQSAMHELLPDGVCHIPRKCRSRR